MSTSCFVVGGPSKALLHASFEYAYSKEKLNVEFFFVDENGKKRKIRVRVVQLEYEDGSGNNYNIVAEEAKKIKSGTKARRCKIFFNVARRNGTISFIE